MNIPPRTPALILSVLLLASGSVLADAPATANVTDPIEEIVVVAHKSERPLRQTAANVTIVTEDDIRDGLSTSLADTFRYVPGIEHESAGNRFGTEGINIRGIGGNRVALLVDGVPVGEQFAIGSFSNATRDFIDAGFVHRAELLHGPASTLYGSDAIGGVLAISTPDPADIAGPDGAGSRVLTTWRGADSSWNGTAMAAAGNASRGLLAAIGVRDGELAESAALPEPLDARDFRRRTALLKFTSAGTRGRTLSGGILHQESTVLTDLRSMLGMGRFAATTALRGDDDSRLDIAHVELGFGEDGGPIDAGNLRGWYAMSDFDQHTLDIRTAAVRPVRVERRFRFQQRSAGVELNLQKDFSTASITHRLGAGIEFRKTRTEELRDGTETRLDDGIAMRSILGEEFPLRDFPVSDTTKYGAWLMDTIVAGDWSFTAGLRGDRYELNPRRDSLYAEAYPSAVPVGLTESDLSPKLGIVRRLSDRLDVWFQYARGFRAPPIEDANIGLDVPLFNIRAIPNPDLRSETSDGFDAGVRWTGDDAELRIGVFHTRYRDFIDSKRPLGPDPVSGRLLFQSQNLNEARIEGVEGAWRSRLPDTLRAFSIDASFYLARGENGDNGMPLNSVGPAQAVVGLAWQPWDQSRKLRLVATVTDAWSERDDSAGPLFEPGGHTIYDLIFTQALGDAGALRAGVMNLTDRTWWHWSAVRGLAPDDPLLPSLAQPGRNVIVSIEWNWQ